MHNGTNADMLQSRSTVLIVAPGGLENGGGVGRMMGYFLNAYKNTDQKLDYKVVDSRGPWFLGSSPRHVTAAAMYLCRALIAIVAARFSSPCLAHINITGRGSTIRKIIISAVARVVGLRYILHVHDYDYADYYNGRGSVLKKLITKTFRGAEAVIVLGQRDMDALSKLFRLDSGRIIVLHNAVPDPCPDLDRRPVIGAPCHLLFLGHLSARKGVPDLLRALASADVRSLPWRATLAGGGPIDEFRTLANDLGIRDRVSFSGWVDEATVGKLCANADVLALPSHAEGLAMSVLEGLSQGLAVITTPVGAHTEVIEPEISGILVPPGDIPALSQALVRLITDENLRKRLANGARRRYLEGFDISRYVVRLAQVHAELFASKDDSPNFFGKGLIS